MTKITQHQSVLIDETIDLMSPKNGGLYLDGTFGGGGHSRTILFKSKPSGRVVGVDRDPEVKELAESFEEEFPKRFVFKLMPYSKVESLEQKFDAVLLDLGFSTDQLEQSGRGFSFTRNEPLDMRFDSRRGQNASQLLNQASPKQLENVFRSYGEDRHAGLLARKIVASRRQKPFHTTFDFISAVGTTSPKVLARLFQALRIAVNDELNELSLGLAACERVLNDNGVLVVISFHSLEDRIVKEFIRSSLTVMTKKPIIASAAEIDQNPRARSAKLRAGRKIVDTDQEQS